MFGSAISSWMSRGKRPYRQSFSQCGEDMIVRFVFDLLSLDKPTYLDIGAHHPTYLNNTAHFYAKGSRGVNVEANPQLIKSFHRSRRGDLNIPAGVGSQSGKQIFYIMDPATMSTFSRAEAERLSAEFGFRISSTVDVPVLTLHDLITDHLGGKCPDLLSIDIEGDELAVLQSAKWDTWKPFVICAETAPFSVSGRVKKHETLIHFFESVGYFAFADTYINTVFVLEEVWNSRGGGRPPSGQSV